MSTYTSRSRFDESRRFTGVYQQMDRVVLDSDWNEEVRIRTADARRRSADVAEGAPDDGFAISGTYVLDTTASLAGWSKVGLKPGDERHIDPELVLDRRDPASLPFVVRSRGHVTIVHALPALLDLDAVPARPPEPSPLDPDAALVRGARTPAFAVAALVLAVRFEIPPNEEEITEVSLLLQTTSGQVAIPLALGPLPADWTEVRIPRAAIAAVAATKIYGWGLTGLPPRAHVWVDSLRAEPVGMDRSDFVIRGGDGTIPGAGRMFTGGVRAFLETDLHYKDQPDYPEPIAFEALAGATPPPANGHFFVYLDLWELPVTAIDDPFLIEPALDGADTTTRLRLVQQVKVSWVPASGTGTLPPRTGGGALTTTFADGDPRKLRYPAERPDPCRDRCLFTASIAAGRGYRGTDNAHVRVEALLEATTAATGRRIALWSRDNASTAIRLTEAAPAGSTQLKVDPAEAQKLSAGDLVVIEDRVTRLQPGGPRLPALRRVHAVEENGTIKLETSTSRVGPAEDPLDVSGALPGGFTVADHAAIRRWDGADWLVPDARYNLVDGIEFAFSGAVADYRPGDYWSFTARIHDPDGEAHGKVQPLVASPPHGPVHRAVPLARIREAAGARAFEDIRPRFLPLAQVRDRLIELGQGQVSKGPFVVVVGDGVRTFGDIDQSVEQGITADEAIQAALQRLTPGGGTLYIRAGVYELERPIIVDRLSRVRILGDGDATLIRALGAGGAFVFYGCGGDGDVVIERLSITDEPRAHAVIGTSRLPPETEPTERPITPDDLRAPDAPAGSTDALAATLKKLAPGEGRTFTSVLATLARLRWLQKTNQGKALDEIPEAVTLLDTLRRLPHGVVTIADSSDVRVVDCRLMSAEPLALGAGVFVTGTCDRLEIARDRIEAAAGVVASPLTAYFSDVFLSKRPAAGLRLRDARVTDNDIRAAGTSVYGVSAADGALDGLVVGGNRIRGFHIGVEIGDRVELRGGDAASRLLVASNRVLDSRVVGILVGGDGVDVTDNEVQNAPSDDLLTTSGLCNAAVQVTGQGVRVRGSWIVLPASQGAPVLGVQAGILVGEGLDDGRDTVRAIFDVDVLDNRIEGAGEATPAAGVVVGGPHPVFDVRVRGNVIRNLGDAAVRLLGTGVATGRIRVDDNRVEQVALAELPAAQATVLAQLELLSPGLVAALGGQDLTRPEPLLAALVADRPDRTRGPLDGVLRWIERLTLRGAIVASRAEDSAIVANHLGGVGRFATTIPVRGLSVEVRTAGVAVVGGRNLVIEDNQIDSVRAPIQGDVAAGDGAGSDALATGPAIAALRSLALAPAEIQAESAELHGAAAAVHRMLLALAQTPEDYATQHQGRLPGALDAITDALVILDETDLAQALNAEIAQLRSSTAAAERTQIADALRVHLSHIARITASSSSSTAAWRGVEDLEGAIAGLDASRIPPVARDLIARAGILDNLPASRSAALKAALEGLSATPPGDARDAVDLLAQAGAFRDEGDRATGVDAGDVFGHRRDIIATLAKGLGDRFNQLAGVTDTAAISAVRSDVKGLVQTLQEAGSDLSRYVLADFLDIDRPTPATDAQRIARIRTTLDDAVRWTQGQPASGAADGSAAVRLAQARADAALRLLVIDYVDERVGRLSDLSEVSDALGATALRVVSDAAKQLQSLVRSSAELDGPSTTVIAALAAAGASDTAKHLGEARDQLHQMREVAGELAAATSGDATSAPATDLSARRLSGLGALLLGLRVIGPGAAAPRPEALELFSSNIERAARETDGGARARKIGLDAVGSAKKVLLDPPAGGDGPSAADEAIARLADLLESMASSVAEVFDTPVMLAAAVLLRAARIGLATTSSELARAAAVRSFLSSRHAMIAPAISARIGSLHDRLAAQALGPMLEEIRHSLERLAAGEQKGPDAPPPPTISTLPEPADGVFAVMIEDQLRVVANRVQAALLGIAVGGPLGHVLAEVPDPADAGIPVAAQLVEISGNQLHACALGAIDVTTTTRVDAVVTVANNQSTGCADLAADVPSLARAGAPLPFAQIGQAVARFAGQGALLVHGNVFHGNGHGHPGALLHEVLADWRGDVVFRSNTVRHTGGGAGGAAVILMVETLDSGLVKQLAVRPALAIDKPASGKPSKLPPVRAPWRGPIVLTPLEVTPILKPHYLVARPVTGLLDLLRPRPLPRLPPLPPSARRSVHAEGNHVQSTGPALLVLAQGTDLISTAVVGNELRSSGATGAVYLRHVDSTVFTGNHCESLGSVNVVVLLFDAAPATVTGNVVVGKQPVIQIDRRVLARRDDLKRFVGLEIAKQAGVLAASVSAPSAAAPFTSVESLFGATGKAIQNLVKPTRVVAPGIGSASLLKALGLGTYAVPKALPKQSYARLLPKRLLNPSLPLSLPLQPPLPPTTPPPATSPPSPPADTAPATNPALVGVSLVPPSRVVTPPDPRAHSLVIVGGTRVVSIGNATAAGALVLGADDNTELNL